MIQIAIDRMPPPDLVSLAIGERVRLTLEDAAHEAYLTSRTPIFSMPIVTAPGQCVVLYAGVLLSFSLLKPVPPGHNLEFDPPIYSCVVPAQ